MIQTAWPYLAVMLLAAGMFPALERRFAVARLLGRCRRSS